MITKILSFLYLFSFLFLGGDFGKKVTFDGGEVYYKSPITEDQAKKLGDFLIKEEYFSSATNSTVQILKPANLYQVRFVVKKDINYNQGFITKFTALLYMIGKNAFATNQIELHLCDDQLKTLKVISYVEEAAIFGKKLTFKGGEVYYTNGATQAEGKKLGDFLVKDSYFSAGGNSAVQVCRPGPGKNYMVRFIVKEGIDQNEEYIKLFTQYTSHLSKNVFNNTPVDIELCDAVFGTLKTIPYTK